MIASGAIYCAALAALAGATTFEIAAFLLLVTAVTDAFWTAMRNTIFQLETAEEYRGRALSTVLLAGRGFTQAAQLEYGVAVSFGGPGFAAVAGALVIALALVAVNMRTPDVRRFRRSAEKV